VATAAGGASSNGATLTGYDAYRTPPSVGVFQAINYYAGYLPCLWPSLEQPPKLGKHALEIKPEWEELDEIAFPRLANVQIEPPEAEDLCVARAGQVTEY